MLLKYNCNTSRNCKINTFLINVDNNNIEEKDLFRVLVITILKANTKSLAKFAFITQFNIKEPKLYS